nr:hypothetical protein [Tanacetum cinerariifolium]
MTSLADKAILPGADNPEAIQADCDVKATNIILQGLPPEIYVLVSTHKVAKDLWERIQMLIQGTSLTKQDMECKLYDEFDSLHIRRERHSVNTKFLNTLPPEWSKFVTDVKLIDARANFRSTCLDFSTSDEQYVSQAPSSSNQSISYPLNDIPSTVNHNAYMASSLIPQIDYAPTVHQHSELSSPEIGLVVPVFQKGDDPIDAINDMICYLQGMQNSVTTGSSRPYASGSVGASCKQRVIVWYNCKCEGHMSKQYTKPKRKRDAEWFKDKVVTPPDGAWTEYVSGGVTLLRISSTKHKERPLRAQEYPLALQDAQPSQL